MPKSSRYIQTAPISRDFLQRLIRIGHATGADVGMIVARAWVDLCPDVNGVRVVRYSIDPVPMVAGYVVRVWPGSDVWPKWDAFNEALPGVTDWKRALKERLLKKYGQPSSDDRQLPLTFDNDEKKDS